MEKLTVKKKVKQNETEKEKRRKRGKSAKNKGANYERKIASIFKSVLGVDLVRTPQSGGFVKKSDKADNYRGDITVIDKNIDFKLHVECKNEVNWRLRDWLNQAKNDCPESKIPVVIFHKQNSNTDYITLELTDFLRLIPKECIIKEVHGD